MIDRIIFGLLLFISVFMFLKLSRGKSLDYKTRIRVYYVKYYDELCYIETKKSKVDAYVKDCCSDLGCNRKDFKIEIHYISKLKYSLMQEI